MRVDASEKGKESCLAKHSSTLLIRDCMLEYFPQVDTAKEALDVDTNNGIIDWGTSNLSKDAAV